MQDSIGSRRGRPLRLLLLSVALLAPSVWSCAEEPSPLVLSGRLSRSSLDDASITWKRHDPGGDSRPSVNLPCGSSIRRVISSTGNETLSFATAMIDLGSQAPVFTLAIDGSPISTRRSWGDSTNSPWFDQDVPLPAGNEITLDFSLSCEPTASADETSLIISQPTIERAVEFEDPLPPNIILIILDTLRADGLSSYGNPRNTSPAIDAWARDAVVFESAIATAPWTLPSHASIFSGLDAISHGVNHSLPAPDRLYLLAERLRDHGYFTMGVTGGAFLNPRYGLDQGFDRYLYKTFDSQGINFTSGKDLDEGIDKAVALMKEAPQPFFLLLHSYEVHGPYEPKNPWFREWAPEARSFRGFQAKQLEPTADRNWRTQMDWIPIRPRDTQLWESSRPSLTRALYDSSVANADRMLGGFFETLDTMEWLDRSVIALTSDHGEALGEKDLGGHQYLYDFNLKVPLVLSVPGVQPRKVSQPVSLIDLAPTLLELGGAPSSPDFSMEGRSLVPFTRGETPEPRPAESFAATTGWGLSVRTSSWKFILQPLPWSREITDEFYDLRRDPREEVNLLLERPSDLARLRTDAVDRLVSGQHMKIRVQGDQNRSLHVALAGPSLRPLTVNALDLGHSEVYWDGSSVKMIVPRGEVLELVVIHGLLAAVQMTLRLEGERSEEFVGTVAPVEGDRGSGVSKGARWIRGNWSRGTPEPGQAGVAISWAKLEKPTAADEAPMSDELSEQLKALGYLD